jgi:histidine triad (HIT) family protein
MANYEATTKEGACIFCGIVAGAIPVAGKFWENGEFMAFLSIDPNTEGFTCVIPKSHYGSDVLKMPDDALQRFIVAAKEVAQMLEKYFIDVGRVGLMMEGTGIDHAHIKLAPFHGTENLKNGGWAQYLSRKEFWFEKYEGWICSGGGPKVDPEHLAILASKIRDAQVW